jgi:hypothetical protein
MKVAVAREVAGRRRLPLRDVQRLKKVERFTGVWATGFSTSAKFDKHRGVTLGERWRVAVERRIRRISLAHG